MSHALCRRFDTLRRRVLASTAVAGCALLAVTGCSSNSNSSSGGSGGTLTIALPAPPESLNPDQDGSGGQNIVQWLTYEPLIHANSDDTYSPGLATSWKYVGTGNLNFRMTLRSGVKFADGTPVDASTVAATINYYIKNPGPMSPFLTGITGATADGSSTVNVTLSSPNPNLDYVFSQIVNWGDVISPAGLANPKQLSIQTYGAGPYKLDTADTVTGDHYVFVKNPEYYNPSAQHYTKVVVKVIADPSAALQALNSGQINIDLNANGTLVGQAKSNGADVLAGNPGVFSFYLIDRAGKTVPALGNVKVREALNYAVDRKAIATALGTGYVADDEIMGAGTDGYDPSISNQYPYDPAKAKQLLAAGGYPNGLSFTVVDLSVYNMDTITQAVVQQLAKVGVKVSIHNDGNDLNKFVADLSSHKYGAVAFRLTTPSFANAQFNYAGSASPLNPYQSTDAAITAAFHAFATASTSTSQQQAARNLTKVVGEQAWFVPVVTVENYVFAKGVGNLGSFAANSALDALSWTAK